MINEALRQYREKVNAGEIEATQPKTPRQKLDGKPDSLRYAVTCFCFECVGNIKADVKNCSVSSCPLWNVRPWQSKDSDKETDI